MIPVLEFKSPAIVRHSFLLLPICISNKAVFGVTIWATFLYSLDQGCINSTNKKNTPIVKCL